MMDEKKKGGEKSREVAEICAHCQDEYILYIIYIYIWNVYSYI